MLKIRMQRQGRRNRAHFRIVVADARIKRQGAYLERLGHYDPISTAENKVELDVERVKHWIEKGAQATDNAEKILRLGGLHLKALQAEKNAARKKAKKETAKTES